MKREDVSTLIQLTTVATIYRTEEEISTKARQIGYELLLKINKNSGYDAVVFKSKSTNEIILSHAGTDYLSMKSLATGIIDVKGLKHVMQTDIINDADIFFIKNLSQIKDALKTLDEVHSSYKGSKVTQVGYSLGGFMAQICYASSQNIMDTLVLDSPGASEVIKKYYPNVKEEERGKLEYYYRTTDAINTCGTRILADSHPVHIIPPLVLATKDALFGIEMVFGTKFLNYLGYTLAAHDLVNFSNDFANTDSFKQVTNWPNGLFTGFQDHLSTNNTPYWQMLVKIKIYPDVCKLLNQKGSPDLLNKVTTFFKNEYLATSPVEFNWNLYSANIDNIGYEYSLSAQQKSSSSILYKTSEFFCFSCCCCIYVPFKVLKAGYNYFNNKNKTGDYSTKNYLQEMERLKESDGNETGDSTTKNSLEGMERDYLQESDGSENEQLLNIQVSKFCHAGILKCITDEIKTNWSDFQSMLVALPQTSAIAIASSSAPKEINLYYGNYSIYGSNFQPADISWSKITKVSYAFLTVGNIAPNFDKVSDDWDLYVKGGKLVSALPKYDSAYATGIYSPDLYDTDPWSGLYKISGYKTNSGPDAWDHAKNTIGELLELAAVNHKSVILSIGGWSCSFTLFHAMINDQQKLLNGIVTFIKKLPDSLSFSSGTPKNVNGIDIDFEPYANDWTKMLPSETKAFVDTILKLRQTLTENFGKDFELSITISGNPNAPQIIKAAVGADVIKQLDDAAIIQVMTYDYRGAFDNPPLTNLHSPLYYDSNQPDSIPSRALFNTEVAMKAYVDAGFSAGNLSLGAPEYGRAYGMTNVAPWTTTSKLSDYLYKPFNKDKLTPLYDNPVESSDLNGPLVKSMKKLVQAGTFKEFEVAGTAFAVAVDGTVTASYDNANTIKAKAQFAKDNGYGGMIFWSGNGDVNGELVTAAYNVFNPPSVDLSGEAS